MIGPPIHRRKLDDWSVNTSEKVRGSVRRYVGSQRKISPKRQKNLVDQTAVECRMKDEDQTAEVSEVQSTTNPICRKLSQLRTRYVGRLVGKRPDLMKKNFEFSSGISQRILAAFFSGIFSNFQWIFRAEKEEKFQVAEVGIPNQNTFVCKSA